MIVEGTGAAVAVAATLAMAQQTAAVAMAGAGKNGGGIWKKRQQRGQTRINQKSAAIAVETAIVVAVETTAKETAAA